MKAAFYMMYLILLSSAATASICNIRGFITFDDGTPVPSGTEISVTNLFYGTTYETKTGIGWPWPNYYLQTLTCTIGQDQIKVIVNSQGTIKETTILPDSRLYWANISVKMNESIVTPENDKESTSSKGSGGGGSGGGMLIPDKQITVDPSVDQVYEIKADDELIIYTLDEWFNVNKTILKATKINDESAKITLPDGRTILLRINQTQSVDIDLDSNEDVDITLREIKGKTAYIEFKSAWRLIDNNATQPGIGTETPLMTDENKMNNIWLLVILLVIVALTVTLIIIGRGDSK